MYSSFNQKFIQIMIMDIKKSFNKKKEKKNKKE